MFVSTKFLLLCGCVLLKLPFSVLSAASEAPPNIDQITYSYNLFLGRTPYEQRSGFVGEQLFTLSNTDTSDDSQYIKYDEINDMSTNTGCFYNEKSNSVYWGTSEGTLQSQSKSSSNGYDQQTSITVSGDDFGIPVSAETSIRNALIFSNSQTSITQYSNEQSSYTYTFDATANREMYGVEIDYDNSLISTSKSWTDVIKTKVSNLGSSPSTKLMLEFFRDIGTHGLKTVSFGQTCTSSAFMEDGYSDSMYYEFNQDTSSNEAGLLWWTSSSSSSESNSNTQQYKNGFRYFYGNKYCRGEVNYASACGGGMVASGISSPAITRWTYKPIWEMDIKSFSVNAKKKMKDIFTAIYAAGYTCRVNYCNDNGQCGTDQNAWNGNTFSSTNYDQFWDNNKCFCDDGYEGFTCDTKSSIVISSKKSWSGYQNEWDATLNYQTSYAICGMESMHHNGAEDRRYGFETCKPLDTSFTPSSTVLKIGTTDYDGSFSLYCDSDKVMTGLYSYHSNKAEDRRFSIYCRKLNGLTTRNCQLSSDYLNNFDEYFKKSCDIGQILHGLYSYHHNGAEDRRFKFRCCDLIRENNYKSVVVDSWTGYVNNWDGPHTTSTYSSNKIFCGVHSTHHNGAEDRRFKFRYCRVSGATLTGHNSWSSYSTWDASFTFRCPFGYFITDWNSEHHNGAEDRRFRFRCAKYVNSDYNRGDNDCVWTPYVNDFDGSFSFTCGNGQGLSGVKSYHHNGAEDRRFGFWCCRINVLST